MVLKVNGKEFDFFETISVSLKHDSVASTFEFTGYFDFTNDDHKRLFRPFAYNRVTIEHNGELLITGRILSNSFSNSSTKELTTISGYSLPGVLADCQIPTDLYPLQFDGQTLRQITEKLIAPFGIKLSVDPAVASLVDSVYDTTTASEIQTVAGYLTELASQKDVLLSHDQFGRLLLTKSNANQSAAATYSEGMPATKISLSTNGQVMHSSITVQKQVSLTESNASQETVTNPFVGTFRPRSKNQSSGTDIDTVDAANNVLSSEFKNAIKLTIQTDRWEWLRKGGKKQLIRPNNIINLTSPNNYIFKLARFFVEQVTFTGNSKEETAVINCVLPEVYNGQRPKNIFR